MSDKSKCCKVTRMMMDVIILKQKAKKKRKRLTAVMTSIKIFQIHKKKGLAKQSIILKKVAYNKSLTKLRRTYQ